MTVHLISVMVRMGSSSSSPVMSLRHLAIDAVGDDLLGCGDAVEGVLDDAAGDLLDTLDIAVGRLQFRHERVAKEFRPLGRAVWVTGLSRLEGHC